MLERRLFAVIVLYDLPAKHGSDGVVALVGSMFNRARAYMR